MAKEIIGKNQNSYERIVQEIEAHIRETDEGEPPETKAEKQELVGYQRGLQHALLIIETYKD